MALDASGLTLLGRSECGLCDELARDLIRLGVPFTPADIDDDERLRQLYDEAVPVLLLDGVEIARAPFSEWSLRQALSRAGVAVAARP